MTIAKNLPLLNNESNKSINVNFICYYLFKYIVNKVQCSIFVCFFRFSLSSILAFLVLYKNFMLYIFLSLTYFYDLKFIQMHRNQFFLIFSLLLLHLKCPS